MKKINFEKILKNKKAVAGVLVGLVIVASGSLYVIGSSNNSKEKKDIKIESVNKDSSIAASESKAKKESEKKAKAESESLVKAKAESESIAKAESESIAIAESERIAIAEQQAIDESIAIQAEADAIAAQNVAEAAQQDQVTNYEYADNNVGAEYVAPVAPESTPAPVQETPAPTQPASGGGSNSTNTGSVPDYNTGEQSGTHEGGFGGSWSGGWEDVPE